MMHNKSAWVWRGALALLIGASTVMTILGAVGTACLAWNGNLYPPQAFGWIIPHMPTYQVLVYVSLAAGIALAVVTYALARGDKWFYIGALIFLVIAGGAAAFQMYLTSSLKKISFFATAPTNVRFYITALTLLVLLIVRIPGVWNKTGLGNPGNGKGNFTAPIGLVLLLTGFLLLTTPMWASPEHVMDGVNYVLVLAVPLVVNGAAMMVGGAGVLFLPRWISRRWAVNSEQ